MGAHACEIEKLGNANKVALVFKSKVIIVLACKVGVTVHSAERKSWSRPFGDSLLKLLLELETRTSYS